MRKTEKQAPRDVGLLTKQEVAERLKLSLRTVHSLIETGALPAVRLGERAVRITPDDLERFIEEKRVRSRARGAR